MTESLYLCSGSLCCALVVCSLVRLIAPSGNTSKIMSFVMSIFALCCLVSPIVSGIKDFDINEVKMSETQLSDKMFSELCDEQVLSTTGEYINSYTTNILMESDITPNKITTVMGINKNRGIYIREMNIYINKKYHNKIGEIKEIVSSFAGIQPEVTEI